MEILFFFIVVSIGLAYEPLPMNADADDNDIFPATEMYALETLYNNTGGYQWNWAAAGARWNFTGYHDPCSEEWQGIICVLNFLGANHIQALDLIDFNMYGKLPSLQNLTYLENLNLDDNALTSSIPPDFLHWSSLIRLQMPSNQLTGSIPDGLWQNASGLYTLNLNYNLLEGTLPSNLDSTPFLQNVLVGYNSFYGSIPYFGDQFALINLALEYNSFQGQFKQSFYDTPFLRNINIQMNQLTGSLVDIFPNGTTIQIFNLANNFFTGSLEFINVKALDFIDLLVVANLFTGPINAICRNQFWRELYLDDNLFTGTIPSCAGSLDELGYFLVNNNRLTGSIPDTFGSLNGSVLLSFEAIDNQLTGTLPDMGRLRYLEYLLIQGNQLSGNVLNLIRTSYDTTFLVFLDLSENQLTGSLPEELFATKYLSSLSVATNCLESYIPSNICNRTTLSFIDFDGMGAASVCQNRFFPGLPYLTAYGLTSANKGGIPECLFAMSRLNTIHLSGNAIEGTLSHDLEIGDSLIDLSLSHNNLRGLIPLSLQQNPTWTNLDLSFNKFSGVLDSEFQANPVNSTITLQVNRLSGHIPHSLKDVENINILSGNMFYCRLNRDSLPTHDTSFHSYQCGSSTFNQSMVAWGVLCLIMLIVVGLAMYAVFGGNSSSCSSSSSSSSSSSLEYIRGRVKTGQKYLAMFDAEHNSSNHHTDMGELYNFGVFLRQTRRYFLQLTALTCLMLLPLYVVLKVFYSNTTYVYAWIVSASYLSGVVPAVILMVVWSGVLLFTFVVFSSSTPRPTEMGKEQPKLDNEDKDTSGAKGMTANHMFQSAVMLIVNCITITSFNGCYVYIVFKYNATIITLAQIAVALSKLLWNFLIVMLCKHLHMSHAVKVHFLTFVVLFNSIIAPLLANAALDPNCLRNLFEAAEDVTSTPITDCNPLVLESTNSSCGSSVAVNTLETSFQPPFIYSYECSSSFVTNYSSVYVFMFLFVSFLSPLFLVAIDKYLVAYKTNPSSLYKRVEAMYYTLMKNPQPLENVFVLFDNDVFLLKTVSKLSIFMTLGVVFPPLAVVVTVAFVVDSLTNQLMIGRFLYRMEDSSTRSLYRDVIAREVRGSSSSLGNSMLKLILPFAALFYSFFLFDTYGDAAGAKQALWCTIVMAVMPIMIWCGYWIVRRASTCFAATDQTDRTQGSVELSVCDESGAVKRLKHSLVADSTARNPLVN